MLQEALSELGYASPEQRVNYLAGLVGIVRSTAAKALRGQPIARGTAKLIAEKMAELGVTVSAPHLCYGSEEART